MTANNKRPAIVNLIFQVILVICILCFVLCIIGIFIASTTLEVYACGSIATYCLINALGITLILRWNTIGFWISLIAYLFGCIASFLIWNYSATITGASAIVMPLVIITSVFITIGLPLFVIRVPLSGKIIWKGMKDGFDIQHSRHIYQLTCFFIAAIGIVMCVYKPDRSALEHVIKHNDPEEIILSQRVADYTLLDSANVTLDEILFVESMIDSIPANLQYKYNKRRYALKHILISGLMSDKHNTLNLKNIFKIHSGELSDDQQNILDWYAALPQAEQELWLVCPPVTNLYDFKKELKRNITDKSR